MIRIKDKHNCCGCSACVQICPKQCIDFKEDEKGFSYPHVKLDNCINCGLCEKVCPFLCQRSSKKPIKVYAAINPNEVIRAKSSSGGVFSLLAEKIIDEGGVVFGACFNERWEVVHDYTDKYEGISLFRGSKYVQSKIGTSYKSVHDFLKKGRKVLFSGTSCQIAGLNNYLAKDFDNLYTVDVVCHGVPSPLVWREYLENILDKTNENSYNNLVSSEIKEPLLSEISFRDKSFGWKKFSFVAKVKAASNFDEVHVMPRKTSYTIVHESLNDNLFLQIFLKNLCLRPSCHSCPAKKGSCGSDFTIADFWGIDKFIPEWDDDKGTSALLINTEKANDIIDRINIKLVETDYEKVLFCNRSLERSVEETKYSKLFWSTFFYNGLHNSWDVVKSVKPSISKKIYSFLRAFLSKIIIFL